jgi:hypothetical protein
MFTSPSGEAEQAVPWQCFSAVQSRKFLLPSSSSSSNISHKHKGGTEEDKDSAFPFQLAELCPSMDLVVVESLSSSSSSSSTTSSLVIYRTLSWQRVATINPTTSSTTAPNIATPSVPFAADNSNPKLCYCWSPNGQWVAVATSSRSDGEGIVISLHGVESLHLGGGGTSGVGGSSFAGSSSSSSGTGGPAGTGPTDAQHSWSIPATTNNTNGDVQALHWLHVGRNHPSASAPSEGEEEQEFSWM